MNQRTLILIGVAIILAILVGIVRFGGSGSDVVSATRRDSPIRQVEIIQESGPFLSPIDDFDAIAERPLFRPDRRPAPVIATPPPSRPAQSTQTIGEPDFLIVGTASGPDGWSATIRTDEATERVYVGDSVEGWRIDDISASRVRVSQSGEAWNVPVGERE